jgi:hypothetical protein
MAPTIALEKRATDGGQARQEHVELVIIPSLGIG